MNTVSVRTSLNSLFGWISKVMAGDRLAIVIAFSLIPFHLAGKTFLYIWYSQDQGIDPAAAVPFYKLPLFLASDLALSLILATVYFLIFAGMRFVTSNRLVSLVPVLLIHFSVILFTVVSTKVNQLYGSPLLILHLRMADNLMTMRESILSNFDAQGMLSLLAGLAFCAFAIRYRFLYMPGWEARRLIVWPTLVIGTGLLAGLAYKELGGVYTYGLKKNAVINFIRYYEPLPEPRDFRDLTRRLQGRLPPGLDWFSTERPQNAAIRQASGLNASARGQNVLLIVLESTADAYIDRETTPNLFRLRRKAIRFDRYYTNAVDSLSANYAIFHSGHIPDQVRYGHPSHIYDGPLPGPGMLETAKRQGYRTGVFFSGLLAYTDIGYLWRGKGTDTLFGANDILRETGGKGWVWGAHESQTIEVVADWTARRGTRPFFAAYLTTYPHHPYHTPARNLPFANETWRDRYRNSLHYVDENIGRLLERLEHANLLSSTTIAVVGDHGETLDDKRAGHGIRMDLNEIQVPFFVYNPKAAGRQTVLSEPANHLDLAPTLMGLLGLDSPEHWSGRNLFAAGVPPRKLHVQKNANNQQSAIVDGDRVYVRDHAARSNTLYRRSENELLPLAETPANRQLITRYSRFALHFEDWILLRHLARACAASRNARPFCETRPKVATQVP